MLSGSLASPTPPKGDEPEERGDEANKTQSRGGFQGAGGVGDTIWRASHPDYGMNAALAGAGR